MAFSRGGSFPDLRGDLYRAFVGVVGVFARGEIWLSATRGGTGPTTGFWVCIAF